MLHKRAATFGRSEEIEEINVVFYEVIENN